MAKGIFITVEGPDGAGKTTQVEFLKDWLEEKNIKYIATREPGGTPLGESLRAILLDEDPGQGPGISAETELLLIFSARMQHLQEVILPALKSGKWVLCDRFTDATYAYQGGGRGISDERILQLEDWVQNGFQPDLTIVLDVPVSVGLKRTMDRGSRDDRFEQQQIDFKQSVRQVYLDRAKKYPHRITLIDAQRSISEIRHDLVQCMDSLMERIENTVIQ